MEKNSKTDYVLFQNIFYSRINRMCLNKEFENDKQPVNLNIVDYDYFLSVNFILKPPF